VQNQLTALEVILNQVQVALTMQQKNQQEVAEATVNSAGCTIINQALARMDCLD